MTNRDPEDKNRENHRFLQIAFTEADVINCKKVEGWKEEPATQQEFRSTGSEKSMKSQTKQINKNQMVFAHYSKFITK